MFSLFLTRLHASECAAEFSPRIGWMSRSSTACNTSGDVDSSSSIMMARTLVTSSSTKLALDGFVASNSVEKSRGTNASDPSHSRSSMGTHRPMAAMFCSSACAHSNADLDGSLRWASASRNAT